MPSWSTSLLDRNPKRNEPAFVENIANFLADLRSTELITIAKQSSKNAEDLFKFDLIVDSKAASIRNYWKFSLIF